jgi:hypothetical protein
LPDPKGVLVDAVKNVSLSDLVGNDGNIKLGSCDFARSEGAVRALPDCEDFAKLSSAVGLLLCNLFEDVVLLTAVFTREGPWGWPGPPLASTPAPPKLMRLEKLEAGPCATDPLLDEVDCDQRFRFPIPSLNPVILFARLCILDRRRPSGVVPDLEIFVE